MSTIANVFTQLYDPEVKAAYQREGSLLRKTVRQREGVNGERVYFPRIGKGLATQKARNADVVPMDIEKTRVFADMVDFYAPEFLDELDLAKVNWSVRTETALSAAYAIGRSVDASVITAANLATTTLSAGTINGGGNTKLTNLVTTTVAQALNDKDVPMDRMRWAIVSPQTLNDLLQNETATSMFFVREQLLITGDKPMFWNGFNWMVHTGLPSNVKGLFWHERAIGLGFNSDIRSRIDWVPLKVSWLVNSYASFGSVIIDNDGVVRLTA